MFRKIACLAAVIAICESACEFFHECEYKGQRIEQGKKVHTEKDCKTCLCYEEKDSNLITMKCCDAAWHYVRYPKTCKAVKDDRDCEKLVLVSDESKECPLDERDIYAVG